MLSKAISFLLLSKNGCSVTIQLLTECIYFVTSLRNHVGDPIKIVDFKPSRDRQKLLREQGVLDQVVSLRCAVRNISF